MGKPLDGMGYALPFEAGRASRIVSVRGLCVVKRIV